MSLLTRLRKWFSLSPPPSDDFWYTNPAPPTAAGVAVDESIAMTYSACWSATMLLSTSGSMIPLKLFRRLESGGSEPATDLRRYFLVHDQFNPHMTNMLFRSSRFAQQINGGNAYAELEYGGGGQVVAAHPIHNSRIPYQNIRQEEDGTVYYLVKNNDGTTSRLESWEVLHIPSPMSDDGIRGKGVITQARQSVGFGIATETQGAAYFGNGGRPSIVITGGRFKDKQDREEYRRQWMEVHGGPSNNAKPALLPEGADIKPLAFSAEDSQFLETRQHNVEEIARWYGVPPHMIQHLLRSTYNNIEQQSLEFVKYSLMRWLVPWEEELNRKLLTPEERRTLYFKHVVEGLERGDLTTRTAALKEKFFNGQITLNEWRALDDLNPIGEVGNIHFVQQAMIPVDIAAKGPQPAAPPSPAKPDAPKLQADNQLEMLAAIKERLDAAQESKSKLVADATLDVVEQIVAVMVERETKDALDAAKKPSQFLKWLDTFYTDHAGRMERALTKPIRACAIATGKGESVDDLVKEAVSRHIASGRESLLQAASVTAEKFPGAVQECVSNWKRTEVLAYLGART